MSHPGKLLTVSRRGVLILVGPPGSVAVSQLILTHRGSPATGSSPVVTLALLGSARDAGTVSVDVDVSAGQLNVHFHGWDKVIALFSHTTAPLSSVLGARAMQADDAHKDARGLHKAAGTGIPGRVKAGAWGTGGRRQLWCWHREEEVLVVDLAGHRYTRMVLNVRDPGATARAITVALPVVRHAP